MCHHAHLAFSFCTDQNEAVIVRILDKVAHTFNPNTEETEEGRFLGVGGHPGLHFKVLSQKRTHPRPLYDA